MWRLCGKGKASKSKKERKNWEVLFLYRLTVIQCKLFELLVCLRGLASSGIIVMANIKDCPVGWPTGILLLFSMEHILLPLQLPPSTSYQLKCRRNVSYLHKGDVNQKDSIITYKFQFLVNIFINAIIRGY